LLEAASRRERAGRMRREVLRMDLGQPDGVNVAEELAATAPTSADDLPRLGSRRQARHAEAESPALRAWLDGRAETGWVSSVLTEIESFRALARYAPDAVSRLPAVLDQIELIDLDPPIQILAQTVRPATVRSLDAIHLGTALHARGTLTSFVTYDKRLLDAGRSSRPPSRLTRIAQPAS
jgi:predicted nucleic acid-binding protein